MIGGFCGHENLADGELPQGGATTAVLRAAFAEMGYEVEVKFWPWKRAIAKAKAGAAEVVAYFPGYHCRHEKGFIGSESMGNGPLGFAESSAAPFAWSSLDDVEGRRIGTVVGYANTEEFDQRVASGSIRPITSADDRTNLLKLLEGQVEAAVVDKLVLQYLMRTDPEVRAGAARLSFDERPLENKQLYLCFRGDAEGRDLQRLFNEGLARIDSEAVVEAYFAEAFTD